MEVQALRDHLAYRARHARHAIHIARRNRNHEARRHYQDELDNVIDMARLLRLYKIKPTIKPCDLTFSY